MRYGQLICRRRRKSKVEKRPAFLKRLRSIVRQMSKNLLHELLQQCLRLHDRAAEVLKRRGGKASF